MILPQLLLMPFYLEDRILLQPLSTSSFNVQISHISARTEISFTVQSSDSSVAVAGGRSLGTRVVDFEFDVNIENTTLKLLEADVIKILANL